MPALQIIASSRAERVDAPRDEHAHVVGARVTSPGTASARAAARRDRRDHVLQERRAPRVQARPRAIAARSRSAHARPMPAEAPVMAMTTEGY